MEKRIKVLKGIEYQTLKNNFEFDKKEENAISYYQKGRFFVFLSEGKDPDFKKLNSLRSEKQLNPIERGYFYKIGPKLPDVEYDFSNTPYVPIENKGTLNGTVKSDFLEEFTFPATLIEAKRHWQKIVEEKMNSLPITISDENEVEMVFTIGKNYLSEKKNVVIKIRKEDVKKFEIKVDEKNIGIFEEQKINGNVWELRKTPFHKKPTVEIKI